MIMGERKQRLNNPTRYLKFTAWTEYECLSYQSVATSLRPLARDENVEKIKNKITKGVKTPPQLPTKTLDLAHSLVSAGNKKKVNRHAIDLNEIKIQDIKKKLVPLEILSGAGFHRPAEHPIRSS